MPYTNLNGTTATVVYYPATSGRPSVFLFNPSPQTAWLGETSGVQANAGFPLGPNGHYELTGNAAAGTIYAIAGGIAVSPFGTIVTSATTTGGTAALVTSGGTVFTAGMTLVFDQGTPRQEITMVQSSNAGTVNVIPAFIFAHGTASTFSQWTPYAATVRAERGAT